jgi:hypothetical protein
VQRNVTNRKRVRVAVLSSKVKIVVPDERRTWNLRAIIIIIINYWCHVMDPIAIECCACAAPKYFGDWIGRFVRSLWLFLWSVSVSEASAEVFIVHFCVTVGLTVRCKSSAYFFLLKSCSVNLSTFVMLISTSRRLFDSRPNSKWHESTFLFISSQISLIRRPS